MSPPDPNTDAAYGRHLRQAIEIATALGQIVVVGDVAVVPDTALLEAVANGHDAQASGVQVQASTGQVAHLFLLPRNRTQ